MFCVLGRRRTASARYQVILKHSRVRSGECIHGVGFGDLAHLFRALIGVGEHG
jgi:hypothetical protein